jgi:hypothetical protein
MVLGGRFRLDCRVSGTGGISLWKATDEVLRRPVAVHLLPAWSPARSSVAQAVQAGARVSDPRLATVFDADYSADCPYIVSEWACDPNLEDLLRTGLPSPALAALIIAEAADALAIAHESGRPHLCLGPRSLHWGRSGMKITGLGIDAALSGADASEPASADTTALARILYALLTGYWPGDEANTLPSAIRPRTGLYEPRQIRAGVPGILNAITCHAMQGQPGWGWPSISTPAGLATALRSAQQALRASASVPDASCAPARPREPLSRGNARHAAPTRTSVARRPVCASSFG